MRRRGSRPGRGFWGRLFGRSLSYDLAERALNAGVTYATITLGHAGFVPGAKHYAAFVLSPEGHNMEAACFEDEG